MLPAMAWYSIVSPPIVIWCSVVTAGGSGRD